MYNAMSALAIMKSRNIDKEIKYKIAVQKHDYFKLFTGSAPSNWKMKYKHLWWILHNNKNSKQTVRKSYILAINYLKRRSTYEPFDVLKWFLCDFDKNVSSFHTD